MENLIQALRQKGWTKWQLSKSLNVTWQTIHMWEKGTFKPRENHLQKLIELNNQTKES